MIRTIHLEAALRKMSGELGRRLRASHLAGWRGRLLLADGREKVMLAIDRSRVRTASVDRTEHAIRGGGEVAQLLVGTGEPEEIIRAAGIRLSGDAGRLVPVLFPNQHPMLGALDRF